MLGRDAGARGLTGAHQGRAHQGDLGTWDTKPAKVSMRHCSRPRPVGMDRRAWPSFITTEGDASNVEAALGTSQRLTETVFGRDLAILNGRRRGTKDFLGRVGDTMQLAEPRSKAQSADPVEVFGAASAAALEVDKPSVRTKASRLCNLPEPNENEGIILQDSGVRALDRKGHRWVRRGNQPPASSWLSDKAIPMITNP